MATKKKTPPPSKNLTNAEGKGARERKELRAKADSISTRESYIRAYGSRTRNAYGNAAADSLNAQSARAGHAAANKTRGVKKATNDSVMMPKSVLRAWDTISSYMKKK